jgi:hypothetical protein
MKIKYFFAISFLLPIISYAQNIFEGVILDKATKAPVPYASIFLMNGKVRANADENGYFKLAVVNNEANDSLIIIDGRLVLERTALISDSVVIRGTQSGTVSITTCTYDTYTGITTVTTSTPHNFTVNDQVTMSGLAFTCVGSTGITTTIFPSPQASFTVTSIIGSVGTSKTFVTNSGVGAGITHNYVSGGLVAPLQMEFICSILENSTV